MSRCQNVVSDVYNLLNIMVTGEIYYFLNTHLSEVHDLIKLKKCSKRLLMSRLWTMQSQVQLLISGRLNSRVIWKCEFVPFFRGFSLTQVAGKIIKRPRYSDLVNRQLFFGKQIKFAEMDRSYLENKGWWQVDTRFPKIVSLTTHRCCSFRLCWWWWWSTRSLQRCDSSNRMGSVESDLWRRCARKCSIPSREAINSALSTASHSTG